MKMLKTVDYGVVEKETQLCFVDVRSCYYLVINNFYV